MSAGDPGLAALFGERMQVVQALAALNARALRLQQAAAGAGMDVAHDASAAAARVSAAADGLAALALEREAREADLDAIDRRIAAAGPEPKQRDRR